MCSAPVTFGGGITMVKGSAPARSGRPASNAPASRQARETRSSTEAGSKVLSMLPEVVCC